MIIRLLGATPPASNNGSWSEGAASKFLVKENKVNDFSYVNVSATAFWSRGLPSLLVDFRTALGQYQISMLFYQRIFGYQSGGAILRRFHLAAKMKGVPDNLRVGRVWCIWISTDGYWTTHDPAAWLFSVRSGDPAVPGTGNSIIIPV